MKMYVANCSAQAQDFHYRVLETTKLRMQRIEPEQQQPLSGDLSRESIAAIAEQHAIYGMVEAGAVGQARHTVHLLFQVDRPVSANQIAQAVQRNVLLMNMQGDMLRKEAAVHINNTMERDDPNGFRKVDVSVQEDVPNGGTPRVNEEIQVRRQGVPEMPQGGRRTRRTARAA